MNQKIKIVYMINSLKIGGPVNMLYNLIKYIDKEEFEITLITLSKCNDEMKKDFSNIECNIIEIKDINLFRKISNVKEIIRKINPDIIHSHGGLADLINGKMKGNFAKFSTVHCVPDEDFTMKKGKIIGNIKSNLFIYNMKKIANPIACSQTVSNKILNKRNIEIDYVRNGIDIEIDKTNQINITKKDFYIDDGKIVLIFCGYLSKRKNVRLLIEAFEKIERNDLVLMVIGDGSEYEELNNVVKNNKNIKMVGRVNNPYNYLKLGDYFISASLSEGLPLAVMEAMYSGLPAILSDIDSHNEIKKLAPKAIELFKNNDINELAILLQKLDKNNYTEKSRESSELIQNLLNAKCMSEQYEKKYRDTLISKRSFNDFNKEIR